MNHLPTNALFQQPWWLDAVAPGAWRDVRVEKGDILQARLPFVESNTYGLRTLIMPPLTQTLGPWLHDTGGKATKQLERQKDLMTALIDQLPPYDLFMQHFHYSLSNALPFYWRGFDLSLRYTYVLPELSDLDSIWSGFRSNIRREIRKAEKQVGVTTEADLERFLDLNELTFSRQGKKLPYSRALVTRLDQACNSHSARKMFFAEDAQGRAHAAVYIVWDEKSAYYLMGGGDPELRNSGATSLLMWEAIQFAATVTRRFDFEGSMLEPVERFFRAFGAEQIPYVRVMGMSRKMKLLMAGRSAVKAFQS